MGLAAIGYDMVIVKSFQKFHLRSLHIYRINKKGPKTNPHGKTTRRSSQLLKD